MVRCTVVGVRDIEVGGRYTNGAGQVREVVSKTKDITGRTRIRFKVLAHRRSQGVPRHIVGRERECWIENFAIWAFERMSIAPFFEWVREQIGSLDTVTLEDQEVPGRKRIVPKAVIVRTPIFDELGYTVILVDPSTRHSVTWQLDARGHICP